ncbi:MAG: sigma-70 family RNA polymerase sigma factor [Ruminococcus sp.]|uniref:RNA polymerase sigma factor n=1 Tax=Ruminococcus sp. TaxID=41978 RepID=UPI0025F2C4BF|nr:hypothetical protein [Ruminococcus sp.]MBO4866760.1 sigma-70 family RNA polymerase sigma factor [Ruminococcus sp.]
MNTNKFEDHDTKDLIRLAGSGDKAAFEKLSANVKPIILNAAKMYRKRLPGYDMDDLIQEGYILLWELVGVKRKVEELDGFRAYFKAALKNRYINLYRHYYSFNPVILRQKSSYCGYNIASVAESEYIKKYRAKQREYYYRKKAEKQAGNCFCNKITHYDQIRVVN